MVALNRIRDGAGQYPAISYWRQIAAEAKARLGSGCIVTYAADWSEYRYHDRGNDEGRDYQSSTVTVRKQIGRSESVNTLSFPIVLTDGGIPEF